MAPDFQPVTEHLIGSDYRDRLFRNPFGPELNLLAGPAHLIRADKTEPFVEGTSSFRSMQDKAVEPLHLRPVNDPLKKEQGYALTAPLRLGEHIYDDGVP